MARLLSALTALMLPGLLAAAASAGDPAPGFTLKDADGVERSLAEFSEGLVVLEWTNHGCPFVRKHYNSDNMQSLQRRYTKEGVTWLSIISSAPGKQGHVDAATARELTVSRKAAPSAVLFDPSGTVGRAYGAKTTPHMYVIADGKIAYAGAIDSIPSADEDDIAKAKNYVASSLDELMAGQPVTTPTSRPYGCNVKY